MNNQNIALNKLNTFAVPCLAKHYFEIKSEDDLTKLTKHFEQQILKQNFYLLGEGSNTLFIDREIDLVIKSALKGIKVWQTDDHYFVEVAAAENWHQLVLFCLAEGIYGLENLALIPGSVGAAPVQNIGAYGVEFANFCETVHWYEFSTQQHMVLLNEQCQFDYRESIFKATLKNKGMITKVLLKLPKKWQPKLSYHGLSELPASVTAETVMNQVITLRQSKLPEPQKLPNAGSFFKNPVVDEIVFERLKNLYPLIPSYPQDNGQVKLAAGWLIEQAGLKGKRMGPVGVHNKQALVLVNDQQGDGKDIVALAKLVQQQVYQQFNIHLEPEVRFVKQQGECNATEILTDEQ